MVIIILIEKEEGIILKTDLAKLETCNETPEYQILKEKMKKLMSFLLFIHPLSNLVRVFSEKYYITRVILW